MADEGAVTVCVRVRPLIARENASGNKVPLHWRSENNTVSDVNGTKIFSYDRVFHSSDSTQQLYDGVAVPIIQSAVRGYNGTIFAYGQTASGKTYTMMGNEDSMGIIPKAIQHVFKIICEEVQRTLRGFIEVTKGKKTFLESIVQPFLTPTFSTKGKGKKQQQQHQSKSKQAKREDKSPDREFLLRVSYMEIYNETITDLLCDSRKKKPLGIREDVNRNTYVEDLIEEVVVAPEQALEWIRKGERNRHYGETKMNEHSSRSHTIFRMIIESRERSDPANANCDGAVMVSHLNLVDLAGSERASQTGSEGVRLKEGCNINRSLFILGQVIKKLCDDPSGFINYRDSKLTRILQNSLGGNAKTVIICTITPVSFDETLSTLQFANTAKGMKNTPKVNEVLDDDALLKRYRKEILDLKKQLEEVSSKTQIHAMEKDQLAQLLEEKNSLQKVQEDRIRNLTEMLVTSASFASKQNAKAKRRRRVTWAPGKINQGNVSFLEDFENAMPTETKKMKLSLPGIPDVEDSALENSEYDSPSLLVPDPISEEVWIAGPNMNWTQKDFEESVQLCEALAQEKDIAVNEVNILQAKFNDLVLENEQLKSEINEMKEKLKEKTEIDEFEALEKQTQKDHEIQLMHEITNLKNLVSNAEVYNQELEAEINSKLEQLKEKESKIKILQNRVEELQNAKVEKKETSFSVGDSDKLIEEIQQLNKSLFDSEAVALDAKKESAFLRSENLELKEKMNELLNNHNQMQKDVQLYQSQIEAGKTSYRKMQADLQRELQSLFQENTRLTSLMEGKVPKDLLSHVELEKKAADLKGELENALKENALLQKQVNELSEFQSLPNTVEMQKKEILEKCEQLRLLKLENEKLLSEVADNEMRLKHMTEEIEKSKDSLADAQLKYVKSDQEYVALKQLHEEIEQKYIAASENNEQMKLQIECLSKEAQESKTTLDEVKLELSSKMKELEEKTAEQNQLLELRENLTRTQQKLNEMEQLKEEERISELRLEAKDSEIQAVLQQLSECREEIKTLTQERDDLKQKGESLQAETEQLREDIKETVSMNILAHEDLRNTQSSLKESQNTVKKLEKTISEKESQILSVEEALGKTIEELQIRISKMTEEMKIIMSERDQLAEEKSESNSCRESDQLQVQKEQIIFLTQENHSLQEKLESLLLKKEEFGEGTLIPQIQVESMEQELLLLREELSQAQRKLHEMEEAKANEYQGEWEGMGRTDVIPKPRDSQEVSTQTEREDEDFKTQLENERDQLRETIQETISKNSEMQEELRCTRESLGQHQETIAELKGSISEKENQLLKAQEALKEQSDELQQKLAEVTENLTRVSAEYGKLLADKEQTERAMNEQVCQQLEKITLLNKEKEELQQMVETCKEREEELLKVQRQSEILKDSLTNQNSKMAEEMKMIASESDQLAEEKSESNSCRESDQLQVQKEQIIFLTQENHSLQEKLESLLLKKVEFGEGALIPQIQVESMEQELLLLREELSQAQKKLHEMEEAKANEYQGEWEGMGRTDVIPKPRDSQEVSTQTEREDEDFKTQLENLQNERDQLRETIQETISKNSEMQEELRCTRESLGQHQETIAELKGSISEKENQLLKTQEALKEQSDELQQKLAEVTENLTRVSAEYGKLLADKEQTERTMNEQVCQQLEQIILLNKEKEELQQMVETCKEREEELLKVQRQSEILKDSLTNQNSKMTEEMKMIASKSDQLAEEKSESNSCRESDQLQVQKEQIIFLTQENHSLQEKLESLLLKKVEFGEEALIPQIQVESMEQELLLLREELSQAQRKLHEMEEAKANEYQGEWEGMGRTDVIPKPRDSQEVSTQTEREDEDFKTQLENLQNERDQLRETIQETISKNSEMQEELRCTRESLGQHQETIAELKGSISEKENQLLKAQEALKEQSDELQQKLAEVTENLTRVSAEYGNLLTEKEQTEGAMNEQVCQQLEQIILLNKEKEELQQMVEACKEREEELLNVQRQSEILKDSLINKISKMTEEIKIITSERDQLAEERSESNSCRESDQLQVQKEQIIFLTQENHSLQEKLESLLLKNEEFGDGTLIPQIQVESMEQELLLLREELSQAQRKLHEMEEAKANEYQGEWEGMGRTDVIPKPRDSQEVSTQTEREDEDFKTQLENLQNERDQLRETIQETISKNSEMQEELRCTRESLGQHQETIAELKGSISEKENQLLKTQEALKEQSDELQQKLAEVTENLTRVSAEYGKLLADKEQTERAMNEQVCQQLEKITLLNKEKEELQQMVETCKEREEELLKVQRQSEILKDSLTNQLAEVTENLTRVSAEYDKLLTEKEQTEGAMNEQVCQQLEKIILLNKEKDELQQMVETCKEREEELLKVQRQSEILKDSLIDKIQQLTETLNSVSCEKDQLLAERTSHSFQLKEQISLVNREKDELQKLLQDVRLERDQLKTELQRNSEMCAETNAKVECAVEQQKQKNVNNMSIQELLEKFSNMGKRYECLSTKSLKLQSDLNSQKALLAVILPQLPLEQSKQVKTLQTKNEEANSRLQKLLTKLKLLFSSVCAKKEEYYTTVNKYKMKLLEEKRKQDHLQSQIQCLGKIYLKQDEVSSQELNSSEGLQSFHLDAESILKDVSEMEHELLCMESELEQQENARKETIHLWEACSGTHWDAEELKEELKKQNERLSQVSKIWAPKVKILLELSSELDARTADYSKNADIELKQRKEKNEELLQDLNTLKEKLAPGGSASLALEEENYRLHNKLKIAEEDKKVMEVKIQKLENVINEVGQSVKEKDDRINKLQAQIRARTERSELIQLQARLNEMDNSLKTALTENRSLQAKLDKGAELYKEEIDHLKTQLVKCDLERMKQSNSFEVKLANYKALAEHREQQLTKLKEELRRVHQEHDVTVLKEADPQQSQKALTCGGGSGIVQSTQILVLKSEQAKLQKENLHLKKQNDVLLSDELQLKEELRKWKERALKWRERSSRETNRETIPKSPKKTVSHFFKEQMPSPSKETVSQETVTQDLSKPLTCPTNFFDNSSLGVLTGTESTEEHLKHLFGTSDKDKAPDCSTQ